jgi:hypothetical protein
MLRQCSGHWPFAPIDLEAAPRQRRKSVAPLTGFKVKVFLRRCLSCLTYISVPLVFLVKDLRYRLSYTVRQLLPHARIRCQNLPKSAEQTVRSGSILQGASSKTNQRLFPVPAAFSGYPPSGVGDEIRATSEGHPSANRVHNPQVPDGRESFRQDYRCHGTIQHHVRVMGTPTSHLEPTGTRRRSRRRYSLQSLPAKWA